MGYLEKYRNRVNQSGRDIGSSLTSRTHDYIDRKFTESPQYRRATVSSYEFPTIDAIDIHTTSIERMGGIKNVIFRPNETLGLGSYLTFDNGIWLIYDIFKNTVATKAIVQECNTYLTWKDAEGTIQKKPCYSGASDLGSRAKQSRSEVVWNKYDVNLPSGQLFCYVENDPKTAHIDIDQRLIFGDKVYKVVGYDNTTLTDMEGHGVIYFVLALTPRRDGDDFETGIADNLLFDGTNTSEDTTLSSWG